ncbi:DUF4276 family protein [Methanocorpusculum vombati]|uniref:DUF4276 family protein n=1 Tax=Methanocorpusculum vombati TaxID=3002864 RepID=A0ABT4IM66_9EURY|nr:DUF4276 family protein [Methanocorpusculum vombati]MCZ0862332.1 DUF4276 family protein [Methanocorpusculum vombati]MCZ9319925.1 DUF4276 family protein [Methanocorpusculum sp.]MDE2519822.1 DUF4276 family protein [Methanocorpusculum sp.]MDE2547231.1 DUF4276 family protein [Methanocorpusculum sp.]
MLLKLHVEGQTEQNFVTHILKPHLEGIGYTVSAVVNPTAPGSRGGLSHYQQFKKNAKNIKHGAPDCLLTTMIDLYGLPNDFPGMDASRTIPDPWEKVASLEEALATDLAIDNFIPYIQLHEFEALLFSNIEMIDHVLSRADVSSPLPQLKYILDYYDSPENIDHNKGPSRHLQDICGKQQYAKVVWGKEIANMIGLPAMREKCPHFDQWLKSLEEAVHSAD